MARFGSGLSAAKPTLSGACLLARSLAPEAQTPVGCQEAATTAAAAATARLLSRSQPSASLREESIYQQERPGVAARLHGNVALCC